jgi:hypothetical protein
LLGQYDRQRSIETEAGNDMVNIVSALNGFFVDVPGGSNVEGRTARRTGTTGVARTSDGCL